MNEISVSLHGVWWLATNRHYSDTEYRLEMHSSSTKRLIISEATQAKTWEERWTVSDIQFIVAYCSVQYTWIIKQFISHFLQSLLNHAVLWFWCILKTCFVCLMSGAEKALEKDQKNLLCFILQSPKWYFYQVKSCYEFKKKKTSCNTKVMCWV